MGVETLDVDESLYSILTMINNGTWQIIQRFPLQSALYHFKEKCPTIAVTVLVGAFPLRDKCPTIAVTVFFLQTTTLTLIGPLFLQFLQS